MKVADSGKTPALSSSNAVFEGILLGLYNGRYLPGQRLIEADLTRQYGVGRSSVREALKRLEAEGVVENRPHRGAYIRALSREDVRNALVVMELILGLAARLAAEGVRRTGEDQPVRQSYEKLIAAVGAPDPAEFILARTDYYRTMIDVGRNDELARLFSNAHVHLVRIQFRAHQIAEDRQRLDDYRHITDAVLLGDGMLAEQAGRAHIRRIMHGIDRLPDEAFAPAQAKGPAR